MAHNEFEHIIQGRFKGFESAPPESVWKKINDFRDRRKKRLLFLWWLLPVLAIAGGSAALYFGNASNNTSIIQNIDFHINYSNLTKQNIESKKTTIASKQEDEAATKRSEVRTPQVSSIATPIAMRPAPPKSQTRKSEIELSPMDAKVIEPRETEANLAPFWMGPPSYGRAYNWQKSVGIRLGTFTNVSRPSSQWAEPPTSLFVENSDYGNASYHRFLEVAPYFQWEHVSSGFAMRAHLLYAASNITAINDQAEFLGNQSSFGLGFGGSYNFVRGRFRAAVYLDFQTEQVRTRYSQNESYAWLDSNSGGGSITQANSTNWPPARYNQWVLAGEAGIRCEYFLLNPWWSLHGGIGYRNYFWRQQIAMPTNEAVVTLPQLLQMNIGVSYQIGR